MDSKRYKRSLSRDESVRMTGEATQREAVNVMFGYQLGHEAPDKDKEAIVAIIKTVAGETRELSK